MKCGLGGRKRERNRRNEMVDICECKWRGENQEEMGERKGEMEKVIINDVDVGMTSLTAMINESVLIINL